jgi:hypothetical protein
VLDGRPRLYIEKEARHVLSPFHLHTRIREFSNCSAKQSLDFDGLLPKILTMRLRLQIRHKYRARASIALLALMLQSGTPAIKID